MNKKDLMYPFGDPLADTFTDVNLIALNNVINLAKERMWLARGGANDLNHDPDEYSITIDDYDKEMADRSISRVESLLQQIEGHIKN